MNTNYCAELIDSLTHKHHVNSTVYCDEINQAIKFRLPDNGRICEVKAQDNWETTFQPYIPILKLPFDTLCLELKLQFESPKNSEDCETIPAVILCKQLDEGIGFYPFLGPHTNGNSAWICYTEKPCLLRGQWGENPSLQVGPKEQGQSEFISIIMKVILNFLAALNCSNAESVDDILPPEKLNKSRIKKGKTPFFSYKVLTINSQKDNAPFNSNSKGSHSSPRIHLRRGHIRKLESKTVWVNACVVGDKKKGAVNKDYQVI